MSEDSLKQRELHKMKLLATSLLVGAFLIYVTALIFEERYAWVGFVRATAEAAMIGAIADWFAVTALFRHPLGLKIPHTAIVPTRKNEIGQKLARFVRQNFLAEEVIADRLESLAATRKVAHWLSQPENSALIADQFATGVAAIITVMKDEDIQSLIEERLVAQIRSTQFAPLLGNLLSLLTSDNRQQELLRELIKLVSKSVRQNRELILKRIEQELPWWAAMWKVDAKIYQSIVDSVDKTLREIRADPKHPLYQHFQAALNKFETDLKTSPELQEREKALKEELLQQPVVRDFSTSLWADIKTSLIEHGSKPDLELRKPIQQMLVKVGETILDDPVLFEKVDHWVTEVVLYLTKKYGYEVEHLIASTISRWDAEKITYKIEIEVGKDLQFIRINGTVIGGLAGLVIYTASFLFRLW